VRLLGPLSFETVPALWVQAQALLRQADPAQQELVVDLGGVSRSDSAGLALLVLLFSESKRRDRALGFFAVPAQVMALARIGGVEGLLPLHRGPAPIPRGSGLAED
jgi:phospholipid transport system transporter-binding protein